MYSQHFLFLVHVIRVSATRLTQVKSHNLAKRNNVLQTDVSVLKGAAAYHSTAKIENEIEQWIIKMLHTDCTSSLLFIYARERVGNRW